jgi:hypothetical protein
MSKFFDIESLTYAHPKRNTKEHIISDRNLKRLLQDKRNVLLIEPNYERKYIPSGLGRIASYVKGNGGKVTYARSYIRDQGFDLVCITSLFTYDSQIVLKTINRAQEHYKKVPILVGGVFASLMPEYIINNVHDDNIRVYTGRSRFLDKYPIDYTENWKVVGEWKDFSYIFTTRGCPNRCPWCAVWRMEPEQLISNWKDQVDITRPNILICDNNLSAQPMDHIVDVMSFIKKWELAALFDGGFDCKYITDEFAKLFRGMKFAKSGLRTAFDRIEEDGIFQRAVEKLKANASRASMLVLVLYNFMDTPKEADYRMSECNRLNVRPYPQRYIPLKALTREEHYVGKHWTDNLARAFRSFWIMPRYFKHMKFEDWIKDRKVRAKYRLTDRDISFYTDSDKEGGKKHAGKSGRTAKSTGKCAEGAGR